MYTQIQLSSCAEEICIVERFCANAVLIRINLVALLRRIILNCLRQPQMGMCRVEYYNWDNK